MMRRPAERDLTIPAEFTATEKLGRQAVRELQTLSVLMPVYNERMTLAEIVRRVLRTDLTLNIELIAVDDHSTDGSWEILQRLAGEDARIIPVRHDRNRGKGAAIQTAIEHMSGEVAVIQDADLEYDPREFQRLLEPILHEKADAVFGSRFAGHPRRVLYFWHGVANYLLTLMCNIANDLNLTDMETCYKMVRADLLKNLTLDARSFTLEPQLTTRLAQWDARIYEVPISYTGRTYDEGKKIGALDGLKAAWEIVRSRFFKTQFTHHTGFYTLSAVAKAQRYNRWIHDLVNSFIGSRVMEAGSGIGNMSRFFLEADRLVLVDYEPLYVARLHRRFGHLATTRVLEGDLTDDLLYKSVAEDRLDTIFSSNVLEHLENDDAVIENFHNVLEPGGHCILVVPAEPRLYTPIDGALGHYRRYTRDGLAKQMQAAGFDVVYQRQFNKVGAISWLMSGKVLRRDKLSPRQMLCFDLIVPLVKMMEHVLPAPGMSLITVGRKRGKSPSAS